LISQSWTTQRHAELGGNILHIRIRARYWDGPFRAEVACRLLGPSLRCCEPSTLAPPGANPPRQIREFHSARFG